MKLFNVLIAIVCGLMASTATAGLNDADRQKFESSVRANDYVAITEIVNTRSLNPSWYSCILGEVLKFGSEAGPCPDELIDLLIKKGAVPTEYSKKEGSFLSDICEHGGDLSHARHNHCGNIVELLLPLMSAKDVVWASKSSVISQVDPHLANVDKQKKNSGRRSANQ